MKQKKSYDVFGIFGYPLAHSLSPAMQEQAFSELGIKAHYLVFELGLKDLEKVWKNLGQIQVRGFNITIPYKEKVISYLDHVTPEARRINAVNTAYISRGKWRGANTDVYGFLNALKTETGFKPKGKKAVVLGAGGAARAVIYGLADEGISEIFIFNRHLQRAEKLCAEYRPFFSRVRLTPAEWSGSLLCEKLKEADLVVNATSLGLKKNDPRILKTKDIPKAVYGKEIVFYDLIYSPQETEFLKSAKQKGHRTLNGVGMLVLQGAKAFEYWTGKKAPVALMRQALLNAIEDKER